MYWPAQTDSLTPGNSGEKSPRDTAGGRSRDRLKEKRLVNGTSLQTELKPPARPDGTTSSVRPGGFWVDVRSVAEPGWPGGCAWAVVLVEVVDGGGEVGEQQLGQVVAEAVAAHDPYD